MKLQGNTIFITGGGSGIGRGLAEAFHKLGNKVIIAGRRTNLLKEVTDANPGMESVELDIENLDSIDPVAFGLIRRFPALNVLINNAGISRLDDAATEMNDQQIVAIITTNLMGPIRLTSDLIEHLKQQADATVINVTSGLAFTPLAMAAVYCATKAALHSYTMSQRFKLRDSNVKVVELAPPYVQTDLNGGADDPRAMKLADFIAETMQLLDSDDDEILVERVKELRGNPGADEYAFVESFNKRFLGSSHENATNRVAATSNKN